MSTTYWIKLYHEILRDPKMARLPDRVWRRAIELFLLAGQIEQDGTLPEFEDIAWQLRVEPDGLLEDMRTLERHGLLTETEDGWIVHTLQHGRAQPPTPTALRVTGTRNDMTNTPVTKL